MRIFNVFSRKTFVYETILLSVNCFNSWYLTLLKYTCFACMLYLDKALPGSLLYSRTHNIFIHIHTSLFFSLKNELDNIIHEGRLIFKDGLKSFPIS